MRDSGNDADTITRVHLRSFEHRESQWKEKEGGDSKGRER